MTPADREELTRLLIGRAQSLGLVERLVLDAPIGRESWYRAGGAALGCLEATASGDLGAVHALVAGTGLPVVMVGAGSNLLVADAGFDGLVVRLARTEGSEFVGLTVQSAEGSALGEGEQQAHESVTIEAGGAWFLPELARRCAELALSGLEWTAGIPGTVGGAVRMNAGVQRDVTEVRHCLVSAEVVDLTDGSTSRRSAEELGFSYRHSDLRPAEAVVGAAFAVRPGLREDIEAENQRRLRHRREAQETVRTAGSVWRNPQGASAYELVRAAGCAALRIGSAQVSPKHANFIIVDKGGAADDVYRLMIEISRRVVVECGVRLHAETVLLGYTPVDQVG